jgi:hypothetical protein
MGRYIVDFPTPMSPEEVERQASTYLTTQGFVRDTYRDQQVWRKGKQWVSFDGPQYVVVSASRGSVHLEAWIVMPPRMEIGTVAIFGRIPMRNLMKRVAHLEQGLA